MPGCSRPHPHWSTRRRGQQWEGRPPLHLKLPSGDLQASNEGWRWEGRENNACYVASTPILPPKQKAGTSLQHSAHMSVCLRTCALSVGGCLCVHVCPHMCTYMCIHVACIGVCVCVCVCVSVCASVCVCANQVVPHSRPDCTFLLPRGGAPAGGRGICSPTTPSSPTKLTKEGSSAFAGTNFLTTSSSPPLPLSSPRATQPSGV